MANLKGDAELKARLKAIKLAFKPAGKAWGDAATAAMEPLVPIGPSGGNGRKSLRVKNVTQTRTTIYGLWYVHILDKGAKAHDIVAKNKPSLVFDVGGRTIFAKKVHQPQQRGMGFARKASTAGLQRAPLAEAIIAQWNAAA